MWDYIVGSLLILHGIVHALGFSTAWGIAGAQGRSVQASIGMPEPAERAFGLLWLVAMIGFVGAGLGLLFTAPWWQELTVVAAAISVIPIVVWWRNAWMGALVDVAAVATVLAADTLSLPH